METSHGDAKALIASIPPSHYSTEYIPPYTMASYQSVIQTITLPRPLQHDHKDDTASSHIVSSSSSSSSQSKPEVYNIDVCIKGTASKNGQVRYYVELQRHGYNSDNNVDAIIETSLPLLARDMLHNRKHLQWRVIHQLHGTRRSLRHLRVRNEVTGTAATIGTTMMMTAATTTANYSTATHISYDTDVCLFIAPFPYRPQVPHILHWYDIYAIIIDTSTCTIRQQWTLEGDSSAALMDAVYQPPSTTQMTRFVEWLSYDTKANLPHVIADLIIQYAAI
jgi:hypothetical protein